MITIYTDGAYANSIDQGGWAFVVIDHNGDKLFRKYDGVKHTTNNRMEIQSVIEAIKYCIENNIQEFELISDSMYVIGTMTLNYKKEKNSDLWKELDKLVNGLSIKWTHERGHCGSRWNEYCDMLAVHGSHINF